MGCFREISVKYFRRGGSKIWRKVTGRKSARYRLDQALPTTEIYDNSTYKKTQPKNKFRKQQESEEQNKPSVETYYTPYIENEDEFEDISLDNVSRHFLETSDSEVDEIICRKNVLNHAEDREDPKTNTQAKSIEEESDCGDDNRINGLLVEKDDEFHNENHTNDTNSNLKTIEAIVSSSDEVSSVSRDYDLIEYPSINLEDLMSGYSDSYSDNSRAPISESASAESVYGNETDKEKMIRMQMNGNVQTHEEDSVNPLGNKTSTMERNAVGIQESDFNQLSSIGSKDSTSPIDHTDPGVHSMKTTREKKSTEENRIEERDNQVDSTEKTSKEKSINGNQIEAGENRVDFMETTRKEKSFNGNQIEAGDNQFDSMERTSEEKSFDGNQTKAGEEQFDSLETTSEERSFDENQIGVGDIQIDSMEITSEERSFDENQIEAEDNRIDSMETTSEERSFDENQIEAGDHQIDSVETTSEERSFDENQIEAGDNQVDSMGTTIEEKTTDGKQTEAGENQVDDSEEVDSIDDSYFSCDSDISSLNSEELTANYYSSYESIPMDNYFEVYPDTNIAEENEIELFYGLTSIDEPKTFEEVVPFPSEGNDQFVDPTIEKQFEETNMNPTNSIGVNDAIEAPNEDRLKMMTEKSDEKPENNSEENHEQSISYNGLEDITETCVDSTISTDMSMSISMLNNLETDVDFETFQTNPHENEMAVEHRKKTVVKIKIFPRCADENYREFNDKNSGLRQTENDQHKTNWCPVEDIDQTKLHEENHHENSQHKEYYEQASIDSEEKISNTKQQQNSSNFEESEKKLSRFKEDHEEGSYKAFEDDNRRTIDKVPIGSKNLDTSDNSQIEVDSNISHIDQQQNWQENLINSIEITEKTDNNEIDNESNYYIYITPVKFKANNKISENNIEPPESSHSFDEIQTENLNEVNELDPEMPNENRQYNNYRNNGIPSSMKKNHAKFQKGPTLAEDADFDGVTPFRPDVAPPEPPKIDRRKRILSFSLPGAEASFEQSSLKPLYYLMDESHRNLSLMTMPTADVVSRFVINCYGPSKPRGENCKFVELN